MDSIEKSIKESGRWNKAATASIIVLAVVNLSFSIKTSASLSLLSDIKSESKELKREIDTLKYSMTNLRLDVEKNKIDAYNAQKKVERVVQILMKQSKEWEENQKIIKQRRKEYDEMIRQWKEN